MEWKIAEHWFASFMFLVSFVVAGAFIMLLLDILEISPMSSFIILFFSMLIIFAPIAKYWKVKFFKKDNDKR